MKKSLYSQAEAALAHKSKKLAESQLRFTNPDRLAATITEYIESRAFAFWVRLIVETEGGVSPDMKALLDECCPGFLDDVDAYRRAGAMSWYRFLRISRQGWRQILAEYAPLPIDADTVIRHYLPVGISPFP